MAVLLLLSALAALCCPSVSAASRQLLATSGPKSREYFLAAEEIMWDYQPSGVNMCYEKTVSLTPKAFLYKKAVFRQYTDATFTTPSPAQKDLGILGPIIRAVVGEDVHVTLLNKLTFDVNLEPSGAAYSQPTTCAPGNNVTAKWSFNASSAVNSTELSSSMFFYSSTLDRIGHSNAGLLGPIIITQPEAAVENSAKPTDVDKEFVLVLQSLDESGSPYAEENMKTRLAQAGVKSEDELPEDAGLHYSINGRTECNLEGVNMTDGDMVRWHIGAVGNEVDLHSLHWHALTVLMDGHRTDSIVLQPGTIHSVDAQVDSVGTWLMHCHVASHMLGGMMAFYHVAPKLNSTETALAHHSAATSGTMRKHYFAAVLQEWDYGPLGGNKCSKTLQPFTEDENVFMQHSDNRIGSKYLKARYVEYTDNTYKTVKAAGKNWEHLGVSGPVLHAEVGDTLEVHLKNTAGIEVNLHPHGLQYNKDSEGALYNDGTSGDDKLDDVLADGEDHTYTWHVTERSGPGPNDPSSVMWLYHSHVQEAGDIYAGLMGAIVVTRKGSANKDGTPKDVDREFMMIFSVLDENQSVLLDQNMAKYLNVSADTKAELLEDEDFGESNLMHSINGYNYCNMPGLTSVQGEKTRFYIAVLGDVVDIHTPMIYFTQWKDLGANTKQSLQLLSGTFTTADATADVPGSYVLQCNVHDHISAGMQALWEVQRSGSVSKRVSIRESNLGGPKSTPREYFIAAEEVEWDFAPSGKDGCSGTNFTDDQKVHVITTNTTMGSKYIKAVYREYTDKSFARKAPTYPQQGILGPLIQAEVGDTIIVNFKNLLEIPANLHMSGGLYPAQKPSKTGEDPTFAYYEEAVAPGETFTYTYRVPADSGPSKDDGDSVAYTYVSSVDEIGHTNAGLVGAVVVYQKGSLSMKSPLPGTLLRPAGVDYVVPLMFNVQNENGSPFLERNVAAQEAVLGESIDQESPDFEESNLMHSINGYVHCNIADLAVPEGARVRLVLIGMGSENDMHAPVVTGQVLSSAGKAVYTPHLMPATTSIVEFVAQGTGTWQYYCAVHDHIAAGMAGNLLVKATR